MVVVLKKLTSGALLSPFDASEEFREGIIRCFRALLLNLLPCSDGSCPCKQTFWFPTLLDSRDLKSLLDRSPKRDSEPEECLLAFLQSQTASAAVGHWLSLLLKVCSVALISNLLIFSTHTFFCFLFPHFFCKGCRH